jgi:hypothetical protein
MHLTPELLARLIDEPADETEAAHLAACARCAAELEEMRRMTSSLQTLPDPEMPELVRRRIARAIEAEPIPVPMERPVSTVAGRAGGGWLRVAAGVAIFVLGGATGTFGIAPRLPAGAGPETTAGITEPDAAVNDDAANEAAATLARAESAYLEALSRYSRIRYDDDGSDPLSRLVALEGIVLTTRSALREAPADPVINGYHLTALGQRDELLRRIEAAETADEWF